MNLILMSKTMCHLHSQIECQKALGMENNEISDGQIRASSSWDGNSVASRGRLSIKASGALRGSWTASARNPHQWLQIDLGANNAKVTGVATQGRQDADQWVTSYKLQYGNDGLNFQYYKDQGADKVNKNYLDFWKTSINIESCKIGSGLGGKFSAAKLSYKFMA